MGVGRAVGGKLKGNAVGECNMGFAIVTMERASRGIGGFGWEVRGGIVEEVIHGKGCRNERGRGLRYGRARVEELGAWKGKGGSAGVLVSRLE